MLRRLGEGEGDGMEGLQRMPEQVKLMQVNKEVSPHLNAFTLIPTTHTLSGPIRTTTLPPLRAMLRRRE